VLHSMLVQYGPDDVPCTTETCSSETRLIININLEVFVVVTVILSLLHIVIHNRMHTVMIFGPFGLIILKSI
jgi:hypothetical protein